MSFFMTDRIMRMAATPSTIQGSSSDMVFASVFAIPPMPFNALMYKSLLSDLDFDIVFSDLGFGFVGSECSLVLSSLVRLPVTNEEEATSCSGDLFPILGETVVVRVVAIFLEGVLVSLWLSLSRVRAPAGAVEGLFEQRSMIICLAWSVRLLPPMAKSTVSKSPCF